VRTDTDAALLLADLLSHPPVVALGELDSTTAAQVD
jgi:hypothetical protein